MLIEERKGHHQSVFDVYSRQADGRIVINTTIYAIYSAVTLPDGRVRHIIYDEQMCPIRPIYRYLNSKFKHKSPSTLAHTVTSLRLLVIFCEANNLKNLNIPEIYCEDFVSFLYRNEKTVSATAAVYFNDIKAFLKHLKREDDPIMAHSSRLTRGIGADGIERPYYITTYDHAPKVYSEYDRVCPPHNTIKDFDNIESVMNRHSDVTGCIIIVLELKMGRRIGEILGLTIEDIGTHISEETGEVSHCMYIRNRTTDTIGQLAKKRIRPLSTKTYKNPDYFKTYQQPRDCVKLDDDIYEMLKSYIEFQHAKAAKEHPDQYATGVTDIVNPQQFASDWGLKENHYLFLNRWGGPLMKGAWNKRLRQYFHEANIPLGFGKSINHSWRHTVAVIMKHELHLNNKEIADFLGHRGTSTVDVYSKADYDMLGALATIVYHYITDHQEEFNVDEICK